MFDQAIQTQLTVLERSFSLWETRADSLPDDLSQFGIPSLKKQDITKAFIKIIDRLDSIKALPEDGRNPFLVQTLNQHFHSWSSPLENWINALPNNVPNIYSHLATMWSQLNHFGDEELPLKEFRVVTNLTKRTTKEANTLIEAVNSLNIAKEDVSLKINLSQQLHESSKELNEHSIKIKASLEKELLISTKHREEIQKNNEEADRLLEYITTYSSKISEYETKNDEIAKQCDLVLKKATDTLAAASRVGMASSFSKRASQYTWPRNLWLALFLISLICISLIAFFVIIPELKNERGLDRLIHFLTELPLTLPFLWLAWFSVLRFSQLGRLVEDYEFKVATALSLEGYKNQIENVDSALKIKLLELAISNFGENPLRLMGKDPSKDAHPLANAVDAKTINEIIKNSIQTVAEKVQK